MAASALERTILPNRVRDYAPYMLDQLFADGELMWLGAGPRGASDGWVRLVYRDSLRSGSSAGLSSSRPSPLERIGSQTDERGEPVTKRSSTPFERGARCGGTRSSRTAGTQQSRRPPQNWFPHYGIWSGAETSATTRLLRFGRLWPRDDLGRKRLLLPHREWCADPRAAAIHGEPGTSGRWWSTDSLVRGHDDHTTGLVAFVERSLDLYGVLTREIVNTGAVTGGFWCIRCFGRWRNGAEFVVGISSVVLALLSSP